MPKLLITSYNPLSAIDSTRRGCILRELGRAHITLQGTCVKYRGDGCTQTSFSRHLWYDWGAPADKHSAQGGVFILLSRRVFNNKMWPRFFVRQLRCKGASALSGCDAAVWTYASCLFTCTLSPKNKLSSTGICNYKGVRAVLC